ncbi:M48 family metalloprotease [Psychrobacillus sp. INOP01]|uniref:M48 family metallopeptidase n=1 Tax=Psychrobacillus sp. INOP01 TaxID=2829187 RepID=UPI001BA9E4A8|nr:M48 family metallopeptidase [Psychrobacillus sp. INOP01]QUG39958.1 M48 family metalloprotease [Psychrobacillus sp. INOP01]
MTDTQLRSSREIPYFILSIIFSALIYFIAIASLVGIAILLVVFLISIYALFMSLGYIRANGIRISEKQFPDVYERVIHISQEMGLKRVPDIFVVYSEGAFNAFASFFLGKHMVVLYSEVFELAREQGNAELDFIIAHELAHIKRNHIWKNMIIMPARLVPFLSQAYSRSCEYTCDRHAAFFIRDGAAAKRGLTILSIGKKLYKEVNEDAYLEQITTESNVIVWLSEVLSSHPTTPKRVQAVGHFMQVEGTPHHYPNTSKIALGIGALAGIFIIGYIGVIAIMVTGAVKYERFFSGDLLQEESFLPETTTETSTLESTNPLAEESLNLTPLMEAVLADDEEAVRELVANGVNLEERDAENTTALHHAVYTDNNAIAELLLISGANPNTEDHYTNALTASFYYENYDMAATLYKYGANPASIDPEGYSGNNIMGVNSDEFLDSISEFTSTP